MIFQVLHGMNPVFMTFFFFLQLNLWHMEVPRLGTESELQLSSTPQPQQHQILDLLSQDRDQTHIFTETLGVLTC